MYSQFSHVFPDSRYYILESVQLEDNREVWGVKEEEDLRKGQDDLFKTLISLTLFLAIIRKKWHHFIPNVMTCMKDSCHCMGNKTWDSLHSVLMKRVFLKLISYMFWKVSWRKRVEGALEEKGSPKMDTHLGNRRLQGVCHSGTWPRLICVVRQHTFYHKTDVKLQLLKYFYILV